MGELEDFLAPPVLKLTPCLEQLAQLRVVRRDLTRELLPSLEVVAASSRVQEEAAGEGADLLARSIIELLILPALLSDLGSAALGKDPDLAQALVPFTQRPDHQPLVQILRSLCQRSLGLREFFPESTLALILGLESRQCVGLLRSAWLGQGLDRFSQEPSCPGSPDVSGEDKKQLRVPIEGFGELYEGLGGGPLDLARLDPADLRSREAAPPCQSTHREARAHARLFRHLGHRHRSASWPKSTGVCTVSQIFTFASDAISLYYLKERAACSFWWVGGRARVVDRGDEAERASTGAARGQRAAVQDWETEGRALAEAPRANPTARAACRFWVDTRSKIRVVQSDAITLPAKSLTQSKPRSIGRISADCRDARRCRRLAAPDDEESTMPFVVLQEFKIEGDDRSTTNYDSVSEHIGTDTNPPDGMIIHTAGWDEEGGVFRILEVWRARRTRHGSGANDRSPRSRRSWEPPTTRRPIATDPTSCTTWFRG